MIPELSKNAREAREIFALPKHFCRVSANVRGEVERRHRRCREGGERVRGTSERAG